jgi:DnaJ-class molecular chaperone
MDTKTENTPKTARFINDGECRSCSGEGVVVIGSGCHQESVCAICNGWGVINPRFDSNPRD